MRRVTFLLSLTLAAACGSSVVPVEGEPVAGVASVAVTSPSAVPLEPAPEFELALSNGEAFTLSGEAKPVYMVFWAEW